MCNNGRVQLTRQFIFVGCICIHLGAPPDILLGEDDDLEVETLPKVAKKCIMLEEYIRDNERMLDYHIYRKRYS